MTSAINIHNVKKQYDNKVILDQLSLHIKAGEFFTLLGPSGCGKTTLLRMIIGFNTIDGGTIEVNNQVVNNIPVNKRNMGMVFQNYAIFPNLSVKENVAFGLKTRKLSKAEIEEKINYILEVVKITEFKDRMPEKLSGGQQQRVALARALVIHPQILLMDEPLSNLDAKLRVEMRNAIKQIQSEIGITTVYVTHDQEEALAISDRIAIMNNGEIQQIGSPRAIYERPANVFVSTFVGTANLLNAKLAIENQQQQIHFLGEYVENIHTIDPMKVDSNDVIVSIRPQDFIISNDGKGFKGIIKSKMFLGLNTHYFIELTDGKEIEAVQDADSEEDYSIGATICLKVNTKKINVFSSLTSQSIIQVGDVIEKE